jgi:hypothetical protein
VAHANGRGWRILRQYKENLLRFVSNSWKEPDFIAAANVFFGKWTPQKYLCKTGLYCPHWDTRYGGVANSPILTANFDVIPDVKPCLARVVKLPDGNDASILDGENMLYHKQTVHEVLNVLYFK